jgi:YHYH protein
MLRLFIFMFGILFTTLATAHDLKHLPLGDNLKSDAPKIGYIWPCHIAASAGGAFQDGPWINADGKTWDSTQKVVVEGDVKWPHDFKVTLEGDRRIFSTNDLPEHGTGAYPIAENSEAYKYDRNPNAIKKQKFSFSLTANPQLAPKLGCAPGAVGIMLSGVSLFSAIDAPGRDAPAHEAQDACNGHPQVTGAYHYHNLSGCIEDRHLPSEHSALLGYIVDGFGIFGMAGESGQILDSKDLDECHGHTHKIMWDGKLVEMYHYHATADFPYTVGCMRGIYDFKVMEALGGPRPSWFDFFSNSD